MMCCQGAGFACSICFSPENAGGSRNRRRSARERNRDAALVRRFYARACRNWALSTLCTGGLFVTGGIALRNPLVTECAAFREAFYEGPHRRLLERIPVRRFTDMNSGLWGSAWFGMRMTA